MIAPVDLAAWVDDVVSRAAICARDRGDPEVQMRYPTGGCLACGVAVPMVNFGPAGWRCGYCMAVRDSSSPSWGRIRLIAVGEVLARSAP